MKTILRFLIYLAYYPSLWVNRLMCALGVWHRWNQVDDCVVVGAQPSRGDLSKLRAMGVGGVINMCEEFGGDARALAANELSQLHLPTLDYHCPRREDIVRGLQFIREQADAGRKVYVHCKAGRGRSPTVALCHLMLTRKISAAEALPILARLRPHLAHGLDKQQPVLEIEELIRSGKIEDRLNELKMQSD